MRGRARDTNEPVWSRKETNLFVARAREPFSSVIDFLGNLFIQYSASLSRIFAQISHAVLKNFPAQPVPLVVVLVSDEVLSL